MEAKKKLTEYLSTRIDGLQEAKSEGKKVVGYYPSGYMSEELVLACGAIPLGLCQGGDHTTTLVSGRYCERWFSSFCKAQIGYRMVGSEPYYQLPDLYVVPLVDANIRLVADVWNFWTDVDIFRYEVPHEKTSIAFDYYLDSLYLLREELESVTKTKISDENLKEAIKLCNEERRLFREISLMRKNQALLLKELDFVRLNHASYISDKGFIIELLRDYREELKKSKGVPSERARILLTGDALARGDYKIFGVAEEAGADIVIEYYCEGLREYWKEVDAEGDLMKNLAQYYLIENPSHGEFTPARDRLEFIANLAKEFNVAGVIWYQTMYRSGYDMEAIYFPKILKDIAGVPMLKLETDYDPTETGAMRTRIEAFLEMAKK